MQIRLSKNFSLRELTKSATAERAGIDNTPKDLEHLVNMTHLAIHILQPVRDEFGVITVNSGYRSPDLNKAVGGSERSQHCHGQAADFESYSVWVHCSYNLMDNRKKCMTAMKTAGKVEYKEGIIR